MWSSEELLRSVTFTTSFAFPISLVNISCDCWCVGMFLFTRYIPIISTHSRTEHLSLLSPLKIGGSLISDCMTSFTPDKFNSEGLCSDLRTSVDTDSLPLLSPCSWAAID